VPHISGSRTRYAWHAFCRVCNTRQSAAKTGKREQEKQKECAVLHDNSFTRDCARCWDMDLL
jgi:hypothetical protein